MAQSLDIARQPPRASRITSLCVGLLPLMSCLLLSSCAARFPHIRSQPPATDIVKTPDYVIVITKPDDTLHSLAKRFLGEAAKYWVIADFNSVKRLRPGQEIVIPLRPHNPTGVYPEGYQTVPILSYHRFGQHKSKMMMTPTMFEAQMTYLKEHDYRVIPLTDVHGFLTGQRPIPQRAVVITIDDGYKSAYTFAYPILKKYGFPATLFVYSDYIGSLGGLTWPEMREMAASKLIDIQPHSKTHTNLALQLLTETHEDYKRRIANELRHTAQLIQIRLRLPVHTFNYPYGMANEIVIEQSQARGYQLGVTVQRGSNAAFAHPFLLRRMMIYGDHSLQDFPKALQVFREENLY